MIDHFGIGIENSDDERAARTLESAGFDGERGGGGSVLVPDPDGLAVQLSAVTERFEGTPPDRGCWAARNRAPDPPPASAEGPERDY